jgi:hypothetical protein
VTISSRHDEITRRGTNRHPANSSPMAVESNLKARYMTGRRPRLPVTIGRHDWQSWSAITTGIALLYERRAGP